MKKIKRLLAALLCVITVVCATGCGGRAIKRRNTVSDYEKQFDEYCDNVFKSSLEQEPFSLVYTLYDYEQYGIEVNAETYDMYLANMKQLMMEQYKLSEMVIINRCTKDSDRAAYRRSVKAVNGRAQVYFESSDGSSNEIEEILPFDVTKDEIDIADSDYGIWYMDAMDNPEKYDGKIIKAKVVVYKPKQYNNKGMFAPGRFAMTCCVEDIRFIGFKCVLDDKTAEELKPFSDREFIDLTAKAKVEYCKEYKGDGVVLYAMDIKGAEKPEDDLVYFN